MTLFVTILQLLCGLIVIGIVLFQSGKSAGLSGAIGGVADSFMAKNKAKSTDARLARATKWVCVHRPDARAEYAVRANESIMKKSGSKCFRSSFFAFGNPAANSGN